MFNRDLADSIEEETFRDDESYLKEIKLLKMRGSAWMTVAVISIIINIIQMV